MRRYPSFTLEPNVNECNRLDLDRWASDIAALTPGNQVQLPSVSGIDRNFRNGYIATFTAGLDHDFRDVKFSASYVGTVGVRLARVYSPNSYVGAEPAFAPFTRFDSSGQAIGGYGLENLISSGSHSSYHALQSSLSKNSPRAGLGIQASYTYSKSLDDTSAVLGGLLGTAGVVLQKQPQNPWDPRAEKGPSTFDVTHAFSASVIQLLYLDRAHLLRAIPKPVTSGWQFLNITTLTSGSPFTVYSGIQQTGVGGGGGSGRIWLLHRISPRADKSEKTTSVGAPAMLRSFQFPSMFPAGPDRTTADLELWDTTRFEDRHFTTSMLLLSKTRQSAIAAMRSLQPWNFGLSSSTCSTS